MKIGDPVRMTYSEKHGVILTIEGGFATVRWENGEETKESMTRIAYQQGIVPMRRK